MVALLCHQGVIEQLQHFYTFMFHTVVQQRDGKNVLFILQVIHCCSNSGRIFEIS